MVFCWAALLLWESDYHKMLLLVQIKSRQLVMDDSSSMHVNSKGIYFLLRKPRRTTQSSVNCVDINYGLHWMAAIKVGYSNSKKKNELSGSWNCRTHDKKHNEVVIGRHNSSYRRIILSTLPVNPQNWERKKRQLNLSWKNQHLKNVTELCKKEKKV